jgi:hypothetical protein
MYQLADTEGEEVRAYNNQEALCSGLSTNFSFVVIIYHRIIISLLKDW